MTSVALKLKIASHKIWEGSAIDFFEGLDF